MLILIIKVFDKYLIILFINFCNLFYFEGKKYLENLHNIPEYHCGFSLMKNKPRLNKPCLFVVESFQRPLGNTFCYIINVFINLVSLLDKLIRNQDKMGNNDENNKGYGMCHCNLVIIGKFL